MGSRQGLLLHSGARFSGKPAMACIQESWSDLHIGARRQPAVLPQDETEAIVFALAQAVEQRDHNTAGHCERMAFISIALGVMVGVDQAGLVTLYRGGFLHDVGKVGIPDSILFKPGKLTAEEWVTMRTHPARGVEICRHLKSLQPVLPLIRHHHERWDGSGYPDGLSGDQIPLLARILQLADIYDALTSPRPYKRAFSPRQALRILEEETARGWRDSELVSQFLMLHEQVLVKLHGTDGSLLAIRDSLTTLQ
jgi:putative two-component system response regulator